MGKIAFFDPKNGQKRPKMRKNHKISGKAKRVIDLTITLFKLKILKLVLNPFYIITSLCVNPYQLPFVHK